MPTSIDELNKRYGSSGVSNISSAFSTIPTISELNSYNEKKRKEEEAQRKKQEEQQAQIKQRTAQAEEKIKQKDQLAATSKIENQNVVLRQATPQDKPKPGFWEKVKSFFGVEPKQENIRETIVNQEKAREQLKKQDIQNLGGGAVETAIEGFQAGSLGLVSSIESAASVLARKVKAEKVSKKLDIEAQENRKYLQTFNETYRQEIVSDKYSTLEKMRATPVRYIAGVIGEASASTFAPLAVGAAASYLGAPVIAATGISAGMSSLLSFGSAYQDAREYGLDEGEAEKIGFMTALMTAPLDYIPEFRLFKRLGGKEAADQVTKSYTKNLTEEILKRTAKAGSSALRQGVYESITESGQTVIENAWVRTYNQNRSLFEGVDQAALSGFFMGSMMDTLVSTTSSLQSAVREKTGQQPGTRGINGIQIEDVPEVNIPFVEPAMAEEPIVAQSLIDQENIAKTKNVKPQTEEINYNTPEIISAREKAKNMPETINIETPERQALREKLAEENYGTGAKKKEKRADIVLGSPASGKSSGLAEPLAQEHGSLIIDSDNIKKQLPEFDNGIGSSATHKESALIADNKIVSKAIENGDNIVLPRLGKNLKTMQELVSQLKDKGYSVHLHYMDLPSSEAAKRAITRFNETGRFIDPNYVLNTVAEKPKEVYNTLKLEKGVDSYESYTNEVAKGEKPKLLERGANEGSSARGERLQRSGIAGNTQENAIKEGLISEAKKYNTPEEFIGKIQGSATQYGEYNPKIRENLPSGYKNISELGIDPNKIVTIYRGIDDISGNVERKINNGDFVTTDFDSAASYTGDPKDVVEMNVKAKDLYVSEPKDFSDEPFYTGSEYVYTQSETKALPSDEELKSIWNEAHKPEVAKTEQQKKTGEGITKVSGLAASIRERAIRKRLTTVFEGLPEYQTINIAEASDKIAKLMAEDYGRAKAIAMGTENPLPGTTANLTLKAVEDQALADGDVNTIRDLATMSTLSYETSIAAQELRSLAERDLDSPVSAIQSITKAREEKVKSELGGKEIKVAKKEISAEIKQEIKKQASVKKWTDFVNSLTC